MTSNGTRNELAALAGVYKTPRAASSKLAARVLSERLSADGRVVWQARVSGDRGRLEVVGVVLPSDVSTEIAPLSEAALRELLDAAGPQPSIEPWRCAECGTTNEPSRRWCRVCSVA